MISEKLIEAIKNNELIIFVGAGCSIPLNFPSWKNLTISILKKLSDEYSGISTLNFENILNQLEYDSISIFDALELIESDKKNGNLYKSKSKEIIYEIFNEKIDRENLQSEIHKLLWQLSSKIITTNYDTILENNKISCSVKEFSNDNAFQILKAQNQSSEFLYKIHGDYNNPDSIILFESDYNKIYNPIHPNEDALGSFFKNKTFLFVGFSLKDPFINKLFEKIKKLYNNFKVNEHFVITTNNEDFLNYDITTIKVDDWDFSFKSTLRELVEAKKNISETTIQKAEKIIESEVLENDNLDTNALLNLLNNKIEEAKKKPSDKTLISEIQDLQSKINNIIFGDIDYLKTFDKEYKNTHLEALFDIIYGSETLTKTTFDEINKIRLDTLNYQWYERSQIVSALACSLIIFNKANESKINLLIDFINDNEDKVWQRALTYLFLILNNLGNKWLRFDGIKRKVKSLTENFKIQEACQDLIEYLLLIGADNFNFSEEMFKNKHFQNPFNYFLPFFSENNPLFDNIYDNYSGEDIEDFIEFLKNAPFPDSIKYLVCNNVEEKNNERDDETKKDIEKMMKHLLSINNHYYPFAGYIQEFVSFVKSFPNIEHEKIINTQLKLTTTPIKEYLLNEKSKYYSLGIHFFKEKQWGQAIINYKRFLEIEKDNVFIMENLANCYVNNKEYDKAVDTREKIFEIKKDYLDNIFELSVLYRETKKHTRTIKLTDRYLLLDESNDKIFAIRGYSYLELKNYDGAIKNYNLAIKLNNQIADYYNNRGISYDENGDYVNALKDYEKAIELEKDPKIKVEFMLNKITLELSKSIDLESTYELLDVAKNLDNKNGMVYNYFANYYRKIGDFDMAFSSLIKAERIDKDVKYVGTKATIYSSMGDDENFYKFLEEALKLNADANNLFEDIKEKYKNEVRFIKLLEKYNQKLE